jgi:biopolymer transport protein ExbB
MSGGISQALVTTQMGLSVAIPLVLFHSLLVGRANRLIERLGKYSSDIVTGRELD